MADAATHPVSAIARLLMLTERRVQQLTKDGVIPKSERGRYELAPAVQGYIRFLQDRNLKIDGNQVIDFNAERARKVKAEADIAEIDAAKARGEVADLADVQRSVEQCFAEIRANLRNIPSRISAQLIGEQTETQIKKVILSEIDAALMSLSGGFEVIEQDDDQSAEV